MRCNLRATRRADVGAERDELLLQREDLVRLAHAFRQGESSGANQLKECVPRIFLLRSGHLGDALADESRIASIARLSDDDLVPVVSNVAIPVFPATGRFHLLANLGADGGVVEAANQPLVSRCEMARMNERRDPQAIVDI